jgi:hypothetical protein
MTVRGIVARRVMLGAGLALTLTVALCWPAAMQDASASGEKRTLSMFNVNTKESLTVTFRWIPS